MITLCHISAGPGISFQQKGYNVKDNFLHYDNKSYIILEKNGKASSSQKNRSHKNIRYFFITGTFKNGEVSVVRYPTGGVIGDYMTKSLQGAMFKKFRDQIMEMIPNADMGLGKVNV